MSNQISQWVLVALAALLEVIQVPTFWIFVGLLTIASAIYRAIGAAAERLRIPLDALAKARERRSELDDDILRIIHADRDKAEAAWTLGAQKLADGLARIDAEAAGRATGSEALPPESRS